MVEFFQKEGKVVPYHPKLTIRLMKDGVPLGEADLKLTVDEWEKKAGLSNRLSELFAKLVERCVSE